MTRMVWKLIRKDKKWHLWMAGLFVLLFTAVFLVNDIFYSVRSDLLEQNQSRYGRHHGIFFDVDRNEIETAEKEDVSQSGWICLTGAFGISGRQAKVSVGYFDSSAMEMEKLAVIKGHMPERKDEIAVEKSRLIKFGKNVSIGSSVTLIDENGRENGTSGSVCERRFLSAEGVSFHFLDEMGKV